MAANQMSNQRNKQGNSRNKAGQTAQRTESEREESSSASTYGAIGDMAGQAQEYVTESAEQVQECIREHSAASVMISLAAGFGIGLLIGRAIGTPYHEPRSRRYRAMAEGFGTRLMDRIEGILPDALAEHFSK